MFNELIIGKWNRYPEVKPEDGTTCLVTVSYMTLSKVRVATFSNDLYKREPFYFAGKKRRARILVDRW